MNKELRGLVIEIITLTLLLIIAVPICVSASNDYVEKKEMMLGMVDASIDISHNGDMKKITVYSNNDRVVKVSLIMKINKFLNDYKILFNNNIYDLDTLEFDEDEEFLYYKLGIYEVDQVRNFDFKLIVKGDIYYDEAITYSFMTEDILW